VQPLPSLEKSATTIKAKLLEVLTQTECVSLSNLHLGIAFKINGANKD
jgi:hypothetical protein